MTATLDNVIVPNGNLILVLTSDELLQERQEQDRVPGETSADVAETGDIRIHVSAEHLSFVSKPFRLFLREDGFHGQQLNRNGQVEIELEEDDPEAMCYLLLTIYGKHDEIPGPFSTIPMAFDTLVEACVLIDKYDLYQPTRFATESWYSYFRNLKTRVSPCLFDAFTHFPFDEDLAKWITVAHILKKQVDLLDLLRYYSLYSTGFLDTDHLPLPERLCVVETTRWNAFDSFNGLLQRYRQSAKKWREMPYCTSNDLSAARECDKATIEYLEWSFRYRDWMDLEGKKVDRRKVSWYALLKCIEGIHLPHRCQRLAEEQKQKRVADTQGPVMWRSDTALQADAEGNLPTQVERWRKSIHPWAGDSDTTLFQRNSVNWSGRLSDPYWPSAHGQQAMVANSLLMGDYSQILTGPQQAVLRARHQRALQDQQKHASPTLVARAESRLEAKDQYYARMHAQYPLLQHQGRKRTFGNIEERSTDGHDILDLTEAGSPPGTEPLVIKPCDGPKLFLLKRMEEIQARMTNPVTPENVIALD